MDLAYLPDCASFVYFRRGVEQPWIDINKRPDVKKTGQKVTPEPQTDRKNCTICKQQKKRTLSNYIKDKMRRDSDISHCNRIVEEEDDCESVASSQNSSHCQSSVSRWGKSRTTSE